MQDWGWGVGILASLVGLGGCFVQNRAFSFYQTNSYVISGFVFLRPVVGSLANFSKWSFVEISLWIIIEVWLLLVPLRAAFLALLSARWYTLASRKSSLECSRTLIIAKAAGKSIVCNNSWIQNCAAYPHGPVLDHPRISTIPQVLLSPFAINPHSCLQPYHPFHLHIVSSDLLSLPDICSPFFSAFCLYQSG